MQGELRGLAIALTQENETGWAVSAMEAAQSVETLIHAFRGNWIGESASFPPATGRCV